MNDAPSAELAGEAPLRVDFYIIEDSAAAARLRLACRLTEKAYLAGQRVLVWHNDAAELKTFDDLLWTFGDRCFVPHALIAQSGADEEPVLLSTGSVPNEPVDVLINLAGEVPACLTQARRVLEIIDGDPQRRQAGRARFKAYRDKGLQPSSHNVREVESS